MSPRGVRHLRLGRFWDNDSYGNFLLLSKSGPLMSNGPFSSTTPAQRCSRPLRRRTGAVTAALLLVLSAGCGLWSDTIPVPPLSGGIQVNEADHQRWLTALQQNGLDSVQVTVYARQQAWNSPKLIIPTAAPSVIDEIRTAKRLGVRVVLVLRVALEQGLVDNRHYWHGMIWPDAAEVAAWFADYRRFALWGAEIARNEEVDLLAIGSELNSMASTTPIDRIPDLYAYFLDPQRTAAVRQRLVACGQRIPADELAPDLQFPDGGSYDGLDAYLRAQEAADRAWTQHVTGAESVDAADLETLNARRRIHDAEWRALIVQIRGVYGGPLSYAANFDQVHEVGFWDALDAIGVNAYYPLSLWGERGETLERSLATSWTEIAANLNRLADRSGGPAGVLPVLLFELGWTAKAGSTVRPFSYHRVEALESTGRRADGSPPLTCVHWATQPDDADERVAALAALHRVVMQGDFPTLRGFMLWKLSTQASHRAIEPFVVVLGDDEADRRYLHVAARLAAQLRRSVALGH